MDGAAERPDRRNGRIARRRVIYVHGFDPRGPVPYHATYRDEAAKQARVNGASIEVGPRRNAGKRFAEWRIQATWNGAQVETVYEVARWDDIVRAMWPKSEAAQLRALFRWSRAFSRAGVIARARREARALHFAFLTPPLAVIVFLLIAVLGIAAIAGVGAAIAAGLKAPAWIGAAPALFLIPIVPGLWRRFEAWANVGWLNRCFAYMADAARGNAPGQEDRIAAFAQRIADAASEPGLDELLVVGHSLGAPHAVRAMAQAVALAPGIGRGRTHVALLTLGNPFAPYSMLCRQAAPSGDAGWLRDLSAMARTGVDWLDVTAPSDPASACAMDVLLCADAQGGTPPVCVSPRFHKILRPETFRKVRRSPIDFHFQYLRAGEIAGGYDYFRLTAGPEPLDPTALAAHVTTDPASEGAS